MSSSPDELTRNPTSISSSRTPTRSGAFDQVLESPPFFIQQLARLIGLIKFALKRQWHHPGLAFLALLGIVLTVGLISSPAIFSRAVDQVLFNNELAEVERITQRDPFYFSVYTYPSARRPITFEAAERASSDIAETLSRAIDLPVERVVLQIESGGLLLQAPDGSDRFGADQAFLDQISLVYINEVENYIETVDGEPFGPGQSGDVLDVWMHRSLAEEMGVNIGETFKMGVNLASASVPVRIQGFWQSQDPDDPYWFNDPDRELDDAFLVRRGDFLTHVQPMLPSRTGAVRWHIDMNERAADAVHSEDYLTGFQEGIKTLNLFIPNVKVNAQVIRMLEEFSERENVALTAILLSFNLPAFGILLYFLVQTAAIVARWQGAETATLISRGMSVSNVLGLTMVEELLLFVVGFPLGLGFGILLAQLMGFTVSFLSFVPREPLPTSLGAVGLPITLLALGVALISRLWPMIGAARQSIIHQAQEEARPSRGPFWYRNYLDLLLLIPTYYAYNQLLNRGSLSVLVEEQAQDLFQDPLLILVPALFVLMGALIIMRLFFMVMRIFDWVTNLLPWLTLHLAFRQLSRQSYEYVNPLLLVIVSLALGVYTLSMAGSLDQWLVDRIYYEVGTDLRFDPVLLTGGGGSPEQAVQADPASLNWVPIPDQYLGLPGVEAATNVGNYSASVVGGNSSRRRNNSRFLAVDRLSFPEVAWYRSDFAAEPLGGLMNRLAIAPNGILVSEQFLERRQLKVGDEISVNVGLSAGVAVNSTFAIVGTYTYFPTVYEEEEETIIGNLDYISFLFGVTVPNQVWMQTNGEVEGEEILKSLEQLGIAGKGTRDSEALIVEEQGQMERAGVFGTLSVGFIAAIAMAILGLLVYSHASLRARSYRFAVLHAIGLSRGQIIAQVVLEYTFLTAFGAGASLFIGTQVSNLFVPFLTITGDAENAPLPPLIPFIAQEGVINLILLFAGIIFLMEIFLIITILYQRLITTLKEQWG